MKLPSVFTLKKRQSDEQRVNTNTSDIKYLSQEEYIKSLESKITELAKKLDNNLREDNTITFQLGHALIEVINAKSSIKNLPNELFKIYGESLKRKHKDINNARFLDKIAILVSNEDLLTNYLKFLNGNDKPALNALNKQALQKTLQLANNAIFAPLKAVELDTISITNNDSYEIANILLTQSEQTLEIEATVVYEVQNNIKSRKAVMLFSFLDENGQVITDIPGMNMSVVMKQFYCYLNATSNDINKTGKQILSVQIPSNVSVIKLSVSGFKLVDTETVKARINFRVNQGKDLVKIKIQKTASQNTHTKSNAIDIRPINYNTISRPLSSLVVASILDEFTNECLSHEVNLISITQEQWKEQLVNHKPDFLLVESCWRGNEGNWGALTKGSGGGKKLGGLLKYCKEHNIPTVFWNKEDPPHYEKFAPVAKFFDLVITTDINMVPHYKKDFDIEAHALSFGAQPKIHNPLPLIPRLDKAVFAGSYYWDKPKRCHDFEQVMTALDTVKVEYDIFDRNYHRDTEKFSFPERYKDSIVGNLPASEVWRAHKGYKYQINMNTVQDSATMFARRVYESLASGTPVISNYSLGVEALFGDLVIMDSNHTKIMDRLKELEQSPAMYHELAKRGVRRVMREHTYGHRIQQICKLVGIDVVLKPPLVTLAVTANTEHEIALAKQMFDKQTALSKHLFIELGNDASLSSRYLNESSEDISYAMKIGHNFYQSDNDYYKNNLVVKCDPTANIAPELLEDFSYWGEV